MRKNLFIALFFLAILLVWCSNSDNKNLKINPEEWVSQNGISIEKYFVEQLEDTQYIKDFDKFVSYDTLLITEDKPFISDFSLAVDFNEFSSLQWWLDFSQKKLSKIHNLETSDIKFSVNVMQNKEHSEPFELSWNVSLLYKNNEMYAKLHSLDVFMWEWNMVAKMYNLLWDLVMDKWIDLEVYSWWLIEIDEGDNEKFPYIVWNFKSILKTENIGSSPDFLNSVSEIIDIVNKRVDLWISTNELKLINYEISYSELWDKNIQKEFTWNFQWKDSAFYLSFLASKKWFEVYLYNIRDYNEENLSYEDTEKDFRFSIKEKEESEYLLGVESSQLQQKILELEWNIKYSDNIEFLARFVLEPIELVSWQKISWELKWDLIRKLWESDRNIPEITGEVLSVTELLSSL